MVGEVLCPGWDPEQMMEFLLQSLLVRMDRKGIGCLLCKNRLSDADVAFALLHFLHHLNGAAFTAFGRVGIQGAGYHRLNSAILRALTQHHQ